MIREKKREKHNMDSNSYSNDLSPYEIARLERIQRNEDRLISLGLIDNPALKKKKLPTVTPNKIARKKKKKRDATTPSVGTRSSKRLKGIKVNQAECIVDDNDGTTLIGSPEAEDDESNDIKVDYQCMPKDPDQLDDDEFQVYVSLRAWRLRRKNELDVEPYKICQNRTLCELIRKKRNHNSFLSRQKVGDEDTAEQTSKRVEQELLDVWGIGPSKAAEDGFGWEMLQVLETDENVKHLEQSRKNNSN